MTSRPDPKHPSALIAAYVEKRDMLLGYFVARTRDRALAEDIVQDLFVRIGQLDPAFQPENPTAFLFQSGRNIWLNHVRSQSRGTQRDNDWQDTQTTRINQDVVADAPSADDDLTARQRLAAMNVALRELPEKTQRIFTLHKVEGIRQADVAARLGISKSSVDKHVTAAVRHLVRRMKDRFGHTDEDLDAQAAQWLVRAMSDEVSDADIAGLTRWLETSPAHLEAFGRAEAVWEDAAHLTPAVPSANSAAVVDLAARRRAVRAAPSRKWAYAALTAAGVAAAAVLLAPHLKPVSPAWQTYQTVKGERRSVQLADGSRLLLNTDSRIRVDLSGPQRRLELDRGEVALAVTHDAARPLSLVAGDVVVRDIGTRFDVYRDAMGVRVAVSEGEVAMEPAKPSAARADVVAGQQARYDTVHGLAPVEVADLDSTLAWQQGRVIYRDVPLWRVVADLNRYIDKPLVVHGPVGQLKVNAVLSLDSEAKIVKALEAFIPVRAVDTAGGIELRLR